MGMARALTLTHVCVDNSQTVLEHHRSLHYCSVPGKRPWALKHNSQFWPAWALTWDFHTFAWKLLPLPLEIRYMGTYSGVGACPGYYGMHYYASLVKFYWMMCIKFHSLVILYTPSAMLMSIMSVTKNIG